jgi:peptidoglycan-associated lipoprotein
MRGGQISVKTARHILTLALVIAVALLVTTDCGKKPEPELGPGEEGVPEEELEPTDETSPPEEGDESIEEEPGDEEISLLLTDIHFDYDDSSLRPAEETILNANAQVMMDNMWVEIVVEGHCDERGTVEYNLALGERRALAAKRYLVSYGIDASRISILSYGKESPVAYGSTEDAWAANRRAHFAVK